MIFNNMILIWYNIKRNICVSSPSLTLYSDIRYNRKLHPIPMMQLICRYNILHKHKMLQIKLFWNVLFIINIWSRGEWKMTMDIKGKNVLRTTIIYKLLRTIHINNHQCKDILLGIIWIISTFNILQNKPNQLTNDETNVLYVITFALCQWTMV